MVPVRDSMKIQIFDRLCQLLSISHNITQQQAAELLAFSASEGWGLLFDVLSQEADDILNGVQRVPMKGLRRYFSGLMATFVKAHRGNQSAVDQLRAIHRILYPTFYDRRTNAVQQGMEIMRALTWVKLYTEPAPDRRDNAVRLNQHAATADTLLSWLVKKFHTNSQATALITAIRIYWAMEKAPAGISQSEWDNVSPWQERVRLLQRAAGISEPSVDVRRELRRAYKAALDFEKTVDTAQAWSDWLPNNRDDMCLG